MRCWPWLLTFLLFKQACSCRPPAEKISIDGSSTVYVISEAVAEEYHKAFKGRISIGISGTGGGFKKLCSGRIRLVGASRPINISETKLCEANNIKAEAFAIGLDGVVVAVNARNNFVNALDIPTLKKLFEPQAEGKINRWSDLNASWPARKVALFAPGISSGTYDFFTMAVVGKAHASRGDITSSEDDNVLVHGIRSNADSIGFFSFAYYQENSDTLKAIALIDAQGRPHLPTKESIQQGLYPLSRPIFLYVDTHRLSPSEARFMNFYLEQSTRLAQEVGFIALPDEDLLHTLERLGKEG